MVYVGDETTLLGDHRMGVFNIKGWDYNPIVPKKCAAPAAKLSTLDDFSVASAQSNTLACFMPASTTHPQN